MKTQAFVTAMCACLLAFPASAIDIVFKDGTVLKNATIYVPSSNIRSNGGPSAYGVNLTVNDKLYIHHYPYIPSYNIMKQVDTNDDGIYETEIIKNATLHYRPPLMFERAPNEFGYSCTVSRIPFIHFSNETLLKMNKLAQDENTKELSIMLKKQQDLKRLFEDAKSFPGYNFDRSY